MSKHIAPPDKRPYRLASAPGDERTYTQNGVRCTYRQIGWHGQSGALYALGEDPSQHEPGSFSPLWLCVGVDTIDEPEPTIDDKLASDAAQLDMDLNLLRTAGLTLGIMIGRARAGVRIFENATNEAVRGEIAWAGLGDEDGDERAAAAPEPDLPEETPEDEQEKEMDRLEAAIRLHLPGNDEEDDEAAPDVHCTVCGGIVLCTDGDWWHERDAQDLDHEASPPDDDEQ